MPHLVPGGKWAYGWSAVGADGYLSIPTPAIDEYGLEDEEELLLMSGSRTSGGFSATTVALLADSPIARVVEAQPGLRTGAQPLGEPVRSGNRWFCRVGFDGWNAHLTAAALSAYDIAPGAQLLVIHGSDRGVGFAARGPIVAHARGHPELEVFRPPLVEERK